MKALIEAKEIRIDGFLCPGHVSSIIGADAYEFIARDFHIPCVISGFEPIDILESIAMLMRQKKKGTARVEIQYKRAVRRQGNIKAQEIMNNVFETSDADWRGMGIIPLSGLKPKKAFRRFDASLNFISPISRQSCLAGVRAQKSLEVLRRLFSAAYLQRPARLKRRLGHAWFRPKGHARRFQI